LVKNIAFSEFVVSNDFVEATEEAVNTTGTLSALPFSVVAIERNV
jgi:hypothetical protein